MNANWNAPLGNLVALLKMIAGLVPEGASYSSELDRLLLPWPPVTNTFPLANKVAA
jgi:hypothetical protein